MTIGPFGQQISQSIPTSSPAIPKPNPRTLAKEYSHASSDGVASATVNAHTGEVTKVFLRNLDDPEACAQSALEAVNGALRKAAGGGVSIDEKVDKRLAQLDKTIAQTSERLDQANDVLDGLLGDLDKL